MRVIVLVGCGSSIESVEVTSEEGCLEVVGEPPPRVAVRPSVASGVRCVVLVDSIVVATVVGPAVTV